MWNIMQQEKTKPGDGGPQIKSRRVPGKGRRRLSMIAEC